MQLPEKCVPFTQEFVKPFQGGCEYIAVGRGKRFRVVCLCRQGIHGPVDEAGRPFVFASRRAAQPLVDVLNASRGASAGR